MVAAGPGPPWLGLTGAGRNGGPLPSPDSGRAGEPWTRLAQTGAIGSDWLSLDLVCPGFVLSWLALILPDPDSG